MKRVFDARRLDVVAFAKAAAGIEGEWSLAQLDRMHDVIVAGSRDRRVSWRADGFEVPVRGAAAQVWLRLQAHAEPDLQCQRCLQPLRQPLDVDRRFLFVSGEREAEQLDTDLDDDVFVQTAELDLRTLVEDELLLALPLVPRHDDCPSPLAPGSDDSEVRSDHPFAGLAALRQRGS